MRGAGFSRWEEVRSELEYSARTYSTDTTERVATGKMMEGDENDDGQDNPSFDVDGRPQDDDLVVCIEDCWVGAFP